MGKIIDKTKGRIKQAAGSLSGDESLRQEGVADEVGGDIKGVVQNVKDAAKDAGRAVRNAIK